MHILVVTDAWRPQVNGVVRTYERLCDEVASLGASLSFLTPDGYPTLPMPTYPEVRLAVARPWTVARQIREIAPDYIHIATEGPLGLVARRWCLHNRHPFTTSYHTRFPEYIAARFPVPLSWGYHFERWFHSPAAGTMVATPSLRKELERLGIARTMAWTRGVDTQLFRPRGERLLGENGPHFVYCGRVAVEKNVEAFLRLDLPGRKVVIGDGPEKPILEQKYPEAAFMGRKTGMELARYLASGDVFVFPSRTDTFGIVMLEAMASGLPVAAFPVTGPKDLVREGLNGALDGDLAAAARRALAVSGASARQAALEFSWTKCAELFISNIVEANRAAGRCPAKPAMAMMQLSSPMQLRTPQKRPDSREPGLKGI